MTIDTRSPTTEPGADDRRIHRVPAHPHFTLASTLIIALVIAVVAAAIGFTAIVATANRDAVDAETVASFVEMELEGVQLPAASAAQSDEAPPASTPVAVTPTDDQPAFGSILPALTPVAELALAPASEINVAYAPNVPPEATRSTQAIVEVNFDIVEQMTVLDPETGVEFETWGYRIEGDDTTIAAGTPGPMVRARVGDILRFNITNPATNLRAHNVDFHAVTGQGGGAADTLVAPGETATIEARMLYSGIFMYHCAAGDVPSHIAHGMYGGILVDPETPLPEADAEFYIVQSEYYLTEAVDGVADLDRSALTDEHPTMVVFNGAKGALAGDNALQIGVGDRARIYFVNAGLNLDSNFHPIGSHWDAVWPEGATYNAPLRGSQTTLVPAGGGVVVDLIGQVPSNIILVDHALTRTFDKGAIGIISVVGDPNPEIFSAGTSGETGESAAADTEPVAAADESLTIVAGSFTQQPLDAFDEFSPLEDPADYSVNQLRIPVGTTVEWFNDDPGQLHTVTAVDGSFDSGFFGQGEAWSYTFTEPGTYEYYCIPHPWMRAMVIVEG